MATPSTGTPVISRRLDPSTGTSATLLFVLSSADTSPPRLASLWLVVAMLVISNLTVFRVLYFVFLVRIEIVECWDLGFLREFGLLPFLGAGKVWAGGKRLEVWILFGSWESKDMFRLSNNRVFGLNRVGFRFWANLLLLYLGLRQV